MDPYFPIILTQNTILCLGTSCFVYRSTILKKQEKLGFYLCLYVGLLITICELISTLAAGKPGLIWLQTLSNFLNIGLTPLLPAIPVLIIGKSVTARKIAMIPVILNLLLLFMGQLFTISADGTYSRDPLFFLFMGCYLFNMLFLTYRSFVFSRIHQNHNAISLFFICLFMISSTTIQLRHPQIHFSWFCVTVTTLMYLIYYADTIHKMDSLTELLNRNAFLDYSIRCRKKIAGVMMIDLDDFKSINDSFGHLMGDKYLIIFSGCLRKVFERCGYCYRLGGDEFCVLLDNTGGKPQPEALAGQLAEACAQVQNIPEKLKFSWGYQTFDHELTIEQAVDLADKQMYASKTEKKQSES